MQQSETIYMLKNLSSRKFFQKITQFSQGNNLLDAAASTIDGFLWIYVLDAVASTIDGFLWILHEFLQLC
jgi:hypothetical protein